MRADTGPIGGNLSHEFIILAETGESQVFCAREFMEFDTPGIDVNYDDDVEIAAIVDKWTKPFAATDEIYEKEETARNAWAAIPDDAKTSARGIEVGHIFHFGTKYSEPMGAKVQGPDGKEHLLQMGSYGIGPTRLMAAIIEASHDEAGIIWPESVAPFDVVIINMKAGDAACDALCAKLETELGNAGLDVLHDDTDNRAGAKFATADLIGVPLQVIVGPRGAASGEVEIKHRKTGERETLSVGSALAKFTVGR
jgi:prolyl-tRNA synthetase